MALPGTAPVTPDATPTFGDNFTEVMSDRRVTFRLLAPKADAVSVLIGLKSAVNEPAGTTTTAMIKSAKGLWTVTLGPFEPNLYEYQLHLRSSLADMGQVLCQRLLTSGNPCRQMGYAFLTKKEVRY